MIVTRRKILQRATAFSAMTALGKISVSPVSAATNINVGNISIQTLSDGHLVLPGSFSYQGLPEDELQAVIKKFNLSTESLSPDCNVTLLKTGDRVVLFDVGAGPDFMPTAGKLNEAMEALGLSVEEVTDVVFTHAHPDHLWGLLDDFDEPVFTNAHHRIGKLEWDYWIDPDTVNTISSGRTTFAVGARRRLEAIENQISFFSDGEEILPGLAARATYGHTPGHMAFEVRDGSTSVMIVGDSILNHHLAFEHPEWESSSDQDPETAVATRKLFLDQLASESIPMIGYHLPNGGLGRVERTGNAYRFVSEI